MVGTSRSVDRMGCITPATDVPFLGWPAFWRDGAFKPLQWQDEHECDLYPNWMMVNEAYQARFVGLLCLDVGQDLRDRGQGMVGISWGITSDGDLVNLAGEAEWEVRIRAS